MSETLPVTSKPGMVFTWQAVPLDEEKAALTFLNDSPAGVIVRLFRGPSLFGAYQIGANGRLVDGGVPRFDRIDVAWADGIGPFVRRGLCRFEHVRAEPSAWLMGDEVSS